MIQSYKRKLHLNEPYDAIIIGSGLGSMTTAALLSKEGKKVLVLERHYTAGGFTHVFKRPGYEWDVGIHYIGGMHDRHGLTRQLFDYITDGQLEWADMGPVYDRIIVGDQTYDFVKGVGNFKAKMIGYFPEDEEAIHQYVDLIFAATRASRGFFMEKALPQILSKVAGNTMRSAYLKYAKRTTLEVMQEITQNEHLIKVLTGQFGDYGLPPAQSSFAMHAAVVRHYFAGGYFPVGGSGRIVDTIVPGLERAGSTVLINAEVEEILVDRNTAVGVRMTDGKEFRAKTIISGTGIISTYGKLLPKTAVAQHHLQEQLQQVHHSIAHLCLYIGLKGSPQSLDLPKANYWVYPEEHSHTENINRYLEDINRPFPVVYISFPSAKDPDWTNRYPDCSTIEIITLAPYEIFQPWENEQWKKRGEEYEAFKEQLSQRLLEALFKLEPHLRDKVDYYELSTPLTTKHFINYEKGEIYGIDHSPERFQLKFLRPHTPIKQFYLTGQDIVSAGIGGALVSGLLTASAITKKNLMKKVTRWENSLT